MRLLARLAAPLAAALVLLSITKARADDCPVGLVLEVDNDTPGSGYSEVNPENFQSHNVEACKGTYRYLSKYVGDGSTDGKAIWQPPIAVAGTYRVVTSFRASANRTDDADYIAYDDLGGSQKQVVSQIGSGCTKVEIADVFCTVGGTCRLVLDGTDDTKSDAADVTTFELLSCEPSAPPLPGRCDGIRAVATYEVCVETDTTCEGVFSNGEGCATYCAAAGMTCVGAFGGEPGCMKEANNPLPCDPPSGHASDYCACQGPPLSGAGGGGGTGGEAAGSSSTSVGTSGGAAGAGGAEVGAGGSGGGLSNGSAPGNEAGGCSCRVGFRGESDAGVGALLLGVLTAWLARRRAKAHARHRGAAPS